MKQAINLRTLLAVAGGLAVATAPGTAMANCNPSVAGAGTPSSLSSTGERIDPNIEFKVGVAALDAENFVAAKRAFDRVMTVVPRDANVLYLAGYARMRRGEWSSARARFEQAVKINPAMVEAQQALGIAYVRTGKVDKARLVMGLLREKAAASPVGSVDSSKATTAIELVASAIADSLAFAQAGPASSGS